VKLLGAVRSYQALAKFITDWPPPAGYGRVLFSLANAAARLARLSAG
jgi:hypothetical protein